MKIVYAVYLLAVSPILLVLGFLIVLFTLSSGGGPVRSSKSEEEFYLGLSYDVGRCFGQVAKPQWRGRRLFSQQPSPPF